jgi:hypothetical protein
MLSHNDLLASDARFSYAIGVTETEFWKAVGAELGRRRAARGVPSTYAFKREHRSAPVTNTLDAIEEGRPGRIDNLDRYCAALETTMLDVMRSVIAAIDEDPDAITADERAVVAVHRDLKDDELRGYWVGVGRGLAGQAPAPRATRKRGRRDR